MNLRQIDIFQPEPLPNNEPQPMDSTSSPAIGNTNVSRSTFYQGDCLVEMDKIADKSIDAMLLCLHQGASAEQQIN